MKSLAKRVLVLAFDKRSEGSHSRLRRTRWIYGNCMWVQEARG